MKVASHEREALHIFLSVSLCVLCYAAATATILLKYNNDSCPIESAHFYIMCTFLRCEAVCAHEHGGEIVVAFHFGGAALLTYKKGFVTCNAPCVPYTFELRPPKHNNVMPPTINTQIVQVQPKYNTVHMTT